VCEVPVLPQRILYMVRIPKDFDLLEGSDTNWKLEQADFLAFLGGLCLHCMDLVPQATCFAFKLGFLIWI
jgi:hypothetical protein